MIHSLSEILPRIQSILETLPPQEQDKTTRPLVFLDIDYTLTYPLIDQKPEALRSHLRRILCGELGFYLQVAPEDPLVMETLYCLFDNRKEDKGLKKIKQLYALDQEAVAQKLLESLSFAFISFYAQDLTEPIGPSVLQDIQRAGFPCYGFTALSAAPLGDCPSLSTWRLEWLNKLGFHFSPSPQVQEKEIFPKNFSQRSAFREGVIFSGGEDRGRQKGAVLKALLKHRCLLPGGDLPTIIFMVDDNKKNFSSLIEAAREYNIPFEALLYAGDKATCDRDEAYLKLVFSQLVQEFHERT
ncbi:MAG: DUF2608 domain-containing protein [Holosporales bacterium]|jgi:hypothetical protein|nr:DUF2608 domain-containing protein [Holosporales bacterium]